MTSHAPYAPLGHPKPVGPDIWMVDGPEIRMDYALGTSIPFPTRMVIVRLPDGRLWLHSPVAPDAALFRRVEALGEPAWLLAPNSIHYWYVPDWAARYPAARTYAVAGLSRRAKRPLRVDEVLTGSVPAAWAGVFDQTVFPGTAVTEAVFHHRPSRTVILCDLIENFEPARVKSRWLRLAMRLAGAADPDGRAPLDLRLTFWPRRHAVRQSARQVLSWRPERVLMAHGRPYLEHGTAELRRALRWAL